MRRFVIKYMRRVKGGVVASEITLDAPDARRARLTIDKRVSTISITSIRRVAVKREEENGSRDASAAD